MLFLVAATATLGAQSPHGAGYTTVTTSDTSGHKTTTSLRTEILGDKYLSTITSNGGPRPVEMTTIIDSIAGTMTSIMPAQSMAMIMARSLLQASPMSGITIDFDGQPTTEVVDLGAGERILGYATHHYRNTAAYTMKVTIGGETCTRLSHDVAEVWTTDDVEAPGFDCRGSSASQVPPHRPCGVQHEARFTTWAQGH